MRSRLLLPTIFLLSFLIVQGVSGQSVDTTILYINKTSHFSVTGDGSAPNWKDQPWVILPQRAGMEVPLQTRIKILYSDSGIYCLYSCEDRKITATLKEDFADLYNEDVVEAFFWPDDKIPMYFEYEVSPLNYELPILIPNIHGKFLGWRPWHYEGNRKTQHATRIIDNHNGHLEWIAEFFIPYRLLTPLPKVPPVKGTSWRANFYRIDYDGPHSDWSWQLTGVNFHDYEKFGTIIFR